MYDRYSSVGKRGVIPPIVQDHNILPLQVYSLSKILFSSTFEEQLDLASLYETDGADVAVLTVASAVEKAVLEPNSCHETFNPYNRFGQTITYSSFKFIFSP